jgi:transcriptional regulator with XRE-family HTH domain
MEETHMDIGKRLAALRASKEMSQGDVEKRTGLLRCYVSRVENGHTTPSLDTLQRWAEALEVEIYQLFFEGRGAPKHVPAGPMDGLNEREMKLFAFFRRANEADRQFMLDVGRKLAT